MKKSRVFSLKTAWERASGFFSEIGNDKITVFAAQASYFIIISSVPFLLLVLGLTKYIVDTSLIIELVDNRVSGNLGDLITSVITEVAEKGGIPFVSLTAVTTLWTSSRAVGAVTRGVGEIYGIRYKENFLVDIVRSIIYTVAFVLLITASIVALMFADTIKNALSQSYPFTSVIFSVISDCSKVVFTVVLTLFFALLFNTVSKKGKRVAKKHYSNLSEKLPRGFIRQLPGAAVAALGWVLFSYFYSLYLAYFPTGYYIYGSLAGILLLMLWLYTCMIILLCGAEINKFIYKRRMSLYERWDSL